MASAVTTTVVSPQRNQLALMRQLLNPKQFKQGIYQAVRRTTNAAAKIFRDIVQERTFLQAKYAKRVIKSRVQGGDLPVGTVTISQEKVPLIGYQVTNHGRKVGVEVMVSKDRPPIHLRHAFLVRLRTAEQEA